MLLLALAAVGLSTAPPRPAPVDLALVDLPSLDGRIRLDIRYAGRENFLGQPLYPEARALLREPVARALVRVQGRLFGQGYGLLVHDAYRPWSVTERMWALATPAQRRFLSRPERASNHNRGCAVDVSLYVVATDEAAPMPSAYDELSKRAAAAYRGGRRAERLNRDRLIAAMAAEGFRVVRHEWWHFDHRDCGAYPVLDLPFDAFPRR
jgi:zinc D-Ala-D-Ala dipeptidase